MPVQNLVYDIYNIPAAGATKSYNVVSKVDIYKINATGGAVALAANMIFNATGTPTTGMQFNFIYGGGVTVGSFNVSFFGVNLTAAQALYELDIKAYYDGSAWNVRISPDNQAGNTDINGADLVAKSVATGALADNAVTLAKTAALSARGNIVVGGAAGALTELSAATSGRILIGDGTDLKSVAVSGDVTISAAGAVSIGAGKVTQAMLGFTIPQVFQVNQQIQTGSVLTLNGTPITLVAAPGAGSYIEVISASASITFNSVAYATNTTLQLICAGADIAQLQNTSLLLATLTKNTKFTDVTPPTAGQTQLIDNAGLQIKVSGGNPTAGNSLISIKVNYRVVTI